MLAIDLLLKRQSNPFLQSPAPSDVDLNTILQAGMKVPDHAGLRPWHFTVVKEDGLTKLSDLFLHAVKLDCEDEAKLEKIRKMPYRAPLIIIVSTKFFDHEKVPKQEQIVATGCSVHAMQMAAVTLGYGAMWRTGELSYHPLVKKGLNIAVQDEIIGYLYIGTKTKEIPLKTNKGFQEYVTYL